MIPRKVGRPSRWIEDHRGGSSLLWYAAAGAVVGLMFVLAWATLVIGDLQ